MVLDVPPANRMYFGTNPICSFIIEAIESKAKYNNVADEIYRLQEFKQNTNDKLLNEHTCELTKYLMDVFYFHL